jgi:hypothetical protein
MASSVSRSMRLSESTVTSTSPRARRKPSASAPRLPRFFGSFTAVTRAGKRAAARSMCRQVSSVLPSSTAMISSRPCG